MRFLLPALALVALPQLPAIAAKPQFTPSIGQSARYRCADGRAIEVLYSRGDIAVVTIGDDTVELAREAGYAGEAYRGSGWGWRVADARAGDLARDGGEATRCRAA